MSIDDAKTNETATPVSITTAKAGDPHLQPLAKNPDGVARVIGLLFVLGIISLAIFIIAYWTVSPRYWIFGATIGIGTLLIGIGLVAWGKYLMPKGPFVEERHEVASSKADRDAFAAVIVERGGGVVKRRRFLGGLFAGAAGLLGLAAGMALLRGLGDNPGTTLQETGWKPNTRLVDQNGKAYKVDDIAVGGIVNVYPEGQEHTEDGTSQSQTVLIRLQTTDVVTATGRETWGPAGCVAYSKLCTHLGCPVGLYEQQLELLVCPCHQSMFRVRFAGLPEVGPAPRPLPQLPLMVNAEGYLVAQSGFHEAVGPGFWERSS